MTDPKTLTARPNPTPSVGPPAAPITVLFLDDEPPVLNALRRSLRREGYELLTTTEVEEALRLLGEKGVDIIVSDHLMPAMTGIEFFALASRLHPNVFRVMLTGQADVDVAIRAINDGHVHRFLTKPWDDEELRRVLRTAAREIEVKRKAAALERSAPPRKLRRTVPRDATGAIVLDADLLDSPA